MTENRRIFINVIATYGRSLYGLVLGLFCGRWTLMALGEIDYGLNGLVGGLTVFIAFFNSVLAGANARFYAFSVGAATVATDKNVALEDCRHWFNTALTIHTLVPFALIVIGYPIGVFAIEHWLTIPPARIVASVWVFRFACIACFVSMLNVPFSAMYAAKQYIAELTVYSFVASTLNVVVLYYMVTHPALWLVKYAAWCCVLSVVPQIIICMRACVIFPECRIRLGYMWDVQRLKKIGWFTGWQMLGTFCGLLRTQGISIVINKFFGAAMNAAQTIGNNVQSQCNTLAGAMQGAFVPVITQACGAGDFKKMNKFVLMTSKFNVLLSMVFMLPLALELPTVMELWLQKPPAFSIGLCYCAMVYYVVDSCTVGHCVAINATGRIAAYHAVLCSISVFTVPVAVFVGWLSRNVYWTTSAVILMGIFNSIGRIIFAKVTANTSIVDWVYRIMLPLVFTTILCAVIGFTPHLFMDASFVRVCITTSICEAVFLPSVWFVILSPDERKFVIEKFSPRFKRLLGR